MARLEKSLKELGYGSRAIGHAFSTLTGPGTVAEALSDVVQDARLERKSPSSSARTHSTDAGWSRAHDHRRRAWRLRDPHLVHHPPATLAAGRSSARGGAGRSRRRICRHRQRHRSSRTTTEAPGSRDAVPHPSASLLRVRLVARLAFTTGTPGARTPDNTLNSRHGRRASDVIALTSGSVALVRCGDGSSRRERGARGATGAAGVRGGYGGTGRPTGDTRSRSRPDALAAGVAVNSICAFG